MQRYLILLLVGLAGCALRPDWHWEKPDVGDAQYTHDVNQCKAATYSSADGVVTKETVRRLHTCMEAKGWRKTPN